MELRRFADAATFDEHAAPFLVAREAAHCLTLGLLATLRHDSARRTEPPYLATVEEAGAVVAVALRTSPRSSLVLSQVADSGALDFLTADLYREYGRLPGVHGPAPHSADFAARWRRLSGQPYAHFMAQRVYQVTRVRPVTGVPGELRPVTAADRALVLAWTAAFHVEAEGGTDPARAAEITDARLNSATGGLALWWHDERPVSLVGHAGPTPHGIRIGPVYTPPDLRGQGYARAAVAALSQRLLDGGHRFCCLFADLANPTSNRLYQSLGYEPVCDTDEYRFG